MLTGAGQSPQPSSVHQHRHHIVADRDHPSEGELLKDAAEDLLAHVHFPRGHRRALHSTNPLERLFQ
jgi:transposase-like protein